MENIGALQESLNLILNFTSFLHLHDRCRSKDFTSYRQAAVVRAPTSAVFADERPAQRKAAVVDGGVRLEDDEER